MVRRGFQRSPRTPTTGANKPKISRFSEYIMAVLPRLHPNSARIGGKKMAKECLMPITRVMLTIAMPTITQP
jgi:hypothetical protein